MQSVNIAVIADDPLFEEALTTHLGSAEHVSCLSPEQRHKADLLLIFDDETTDETLHWMMRGAKQSNQDDLSILLITDNVSKRRLVRAVRYGLAGVLPRSRVNFDQILETIFTISQGSLEFPDDLASMLIEQFKSTVRRGSTVQAVGAKRLSQREVDVLRLLADGLSTSEVAKKLNCSERTVGNVLHEVVLRLGLRNRVHAVSYAFQVGAI